MSHIFFTLVILLLTFFGGTQTLDTPQAQQDDGKRLVYETQEYVQEDGQYASRTAIHSLGLDGTDDRIIFEGQQPSGLRGIVMFSLDDRLLVIQEPKPWMVFTTAGEDVTDQYDFTKIENDVQRGARLRSPDGKKIAFVTTPDFGTTQGDDVQPGTVFVIDQTTGERKSYVDPSFDLGIVSLYPEAWSPDGRFLYVLSSIWEGPAALHMWRIDTVSGEIYKYKNTEGILALSMHLDPAAGIGVGMKAAAGTDLSDPIHAPSSIIVLDLNDDIAEVIKQSPTTLLGDTYPVLRGSSILFTESHDRGLDSYGIRQWGDTILQLMNRFDFSTNIILSAPDGLYIFDVTDDGQVIYETRQRVRQDEENYEYTYHVYDIYTQQDTTLLRRDSRFSILGVL